MGARKVRVARCIFSALDCVKLQRGPSEHPSAIRITIRLALELVGKPYDLPTSSNAKRIIKRLADGCSKGPRCIFSALNCVKLQRGLFEHPLAIRITIRLALELARKAYDLSASSNANRLIVRLAHECSVGLRCVFNAIDCVKLQRGPFEHPSASCITIRLALELVGKTYNLSISFNAKRITKRLVDGCSEGPRCIFSALYCVKLQRGPFEHPSTSRITIWLALELACRPYDLSASSNENRLTIRLADGCSKDPRCVFSVLNCVKLQRGPSKHPSISRITIRLAIEHNGKTYDLSASSNAKRITKRLADACSKGPRCVFNALDCVKLQCGPFELPSASRITIRLSLELAGKPYDLPASSNAKHITKRLADGCSEDPRCVFSALNCVKLQLEPFEYPWASRITIRLALELAGKPYDLSASSNASRLTIRLVDGCLKDPRCIFNALNCVKLKRGPSEHPSASRIIIRFALELASKSYDLPANSNTKRITKRLADGWSEDSRCVFSALDCVKLQRGPFEHPSIADKSYDLLVSFNASRITKRLADECSKAPCYVFSALECVKLQRRPSEHPSASRATIRLALELVDKPHDLPASSNASRLTIRLADGCSEGPRCDFSALDYVKLQREPSEHPSASRITIRLALELAGKPYDLPASFNAIRITKRFADGCSKVPRCVFSALYCFALELAGEPYDLLSSSNANRITKRLADGCSKGPRCVFSALYCVKLQRGSFEHPSASRITIRLALKLADKPYDLSTSSNASRLTIRITDGCSEDPRCVFSALDCVKLQRGTSEHTSTSRIIIRLALELVGKPYNLPASFNAIRITKRLVHGCSKSPRCIFSALNCVKLQRGLFEHPSAIRIPIRLALELAGKPYDLPASSNASRLIVRLTHECSVGLRCVFSAIDCVKLQRGSFEHPSARRITIRFALELVGKPYNLSISFNAIRITKRLADGCSKGPRCIFSALHCVKLQRGLFEHPSISRITIRLALELAGKPYDLLASFNASRITKRLADGCSKAPCCLFSALDCVKLQRRLFEHPSASRITIRRALELADKPHDLPASFNASRLTIRLADGCSKGPRCDFSALNCVKLQRGPSEHPSASRITIRLALELAGKPYDLPTSFNAIRITKRLTDGCSEGPRYVFSALYCVKLQRGSFEHPSASRITIGLALKLVGKPYDLSVNSNASRLTIRLTDGCSEGGPEVERSGGPIASHGGGNRDDGGSGGAANDNEDDVSDSQSDGSYSDPA
ncbi:hypothetical protein L7F22_033415 [Adiantum nelumboides]|nr:hypothetical protein [Adiantum nelumboides]